MKKKVNKRAKNQLEVVIENIGNHCSVEELLKEAEKSNVKSEVIEEYILLPTGELVIK